MTPLTFFYINKNIGDSISIVGKRSLVGLMVKEVVVDSRKIGAHLLQFVLY